MSSRAQRTGLGPRASAAASPAIADAALVDIWTFSQVPSLGGIDLSGFSVEATDGEIGKVDEATYEIGGSYLIVDLGPWIVGKKVLLPAGVVARIDTGKKEIFLDCSKDSIKKAPQAPEYDPNFGWVDRSFRDRLGRYYCGRERRSLST